MKIIKFLLQFLLITIFYIIGEGLQNLFRLSIPGSIIGLILLFLFLSCKILPETWVNQGANFLLSLMPLFLVPATVGAMNYFHIFHGKGILLIIGIIISTCIIFVASAFICEKWGKNSFKEKEKHLA